MSLFLIKGRDRNLSYGDKTFKMLKEIPRDKTGNPLTLEGAVRSVILKSPDTFQWRDDALCTLYAVLGAGIVWNKAGRLVDHCPNNYMNMPPEPSFGLYTDDHGMEDSLDQMGINATGDYKDLYDQLTAKRYEELNEAIDTIDQIDLRCKQYRKGKRKWYPISWYSCRLCAPHNARKDFFLGAYETATLMAMREIDLDEGRWTQQMHTKNVACEILEILKIQAAMHGFGMPQKKKKGRT